MDDHGVENISNLPISCCSTVSGEDDVLVGWKEGGWYRQLVSSPTRPTPFHTVQNGPIQYHARTQIKRTRVKVPSFGFCDVKVSQTWVGLPNQMISLILIFGFVCRYPDDQEI